MDLTEIMPKDFELPAAFADRAGMHYSGNVSTTHKKEAGQFFTPVPIARFMAGLAFTAKEHISILDPGCGTAILSCALIEHLIQTTSNIAEIKLTVYELDANLLPLTQTVLNYLKHWAAEKGVMMSVTILNTDFILAHTGFLQEEVQTIFERPTESFDFIISNPPYFKLGKDDPRVLATKSWINGQANIYSLFMAVSTQLLASDGELIFIVPRSFSSGDYFREFRQFFFRKIQTQHLHLFVSRRDAFGRDKVLQETLILKAAKTPKVDARQFVTLSTSHGLKDLSEPQQRIYKISELIDYGTDGLILHLPTSEAEEQIIQLFKSWKNRLQDHNIQISTGPVVSFRAWDFIRDVYQNGTVHLAPLYWLHNVTKMKLCWPVPKKDKGQYMEVSSESASLLLPNKNYVFLRRFSAKDDKSRLVAAPYFKEMHETEFIGVENKLNYIHRKNGALEREEIMGLSALLNSKVFDRYFRTFNGNVNVSATELRQMPMPPLEIIKEIGAQIANTYALSQEHLDELICDFFGLNTSIVHEQD